MGGGPELHTATKVPRRKNMPIIARVFIEALPAGTYDPERNTHPQYQSSTSTQRTLKPSDTKSPFSLTLYLLPHPLLTTPR